MIQKILNKWQVHFHFGKDYRTIERGWKQCEFGIFNIHTEPEDGTMLHSGLYRGFLFRFYVWLPIDF